MNIQIEPVDALEVMGHPALTGLDPDSVEWIDVTTSFLDTAVVVICGLHAGRMLEAVNGCRLLVRPQTAGQILAGMKRPVASDAQELVSLALTAVASVAKEDGAGLELLSSMIESGRVEVIFLTTSRGHVGAGFTPRILFHRRDGSALALDTRAMDFPPALQGFGRNMRPAVLDSQVEDSEDAVRQLVAGFDDLWDGVIPDESVVRLDPRASFRIIRESVVHESTPDRHANPPESGLANLEGAPERPGKPATGVEDQAAGEPVYAPTEARAFAEDTNRDGDDESFGPAAYADGERYANIPAVDEDIVADYYRAAGSTPLLDAADEIRLAKRIEVGVLASEQLSSMSPDVVRSPDGRTLQWLVRDGSAAFSHMVSANLRLVLSIARRSRHRGLPFMDVIQEGNLGLIRAVQKFDHMKGFKFSTYASWWIRQAITRAIADQSRMIRVPVHMDEQVKQIAAVRHRLAEHSVNQPSTEDIADAADLAVEDVMKMLDWDQEPLSLDLVIGSERYESGSIEITLGSVLEDDHMSDEALVEWADVHFCKAAIGEVLGELTEREEGVIRMRFGLDGRPLMTLDEIGAVFAVTRERIRQIEKKVMNRLREPVVSVRLRGHLG